MNSAQRMVREGVVIQFERVGYEFRKRMDEEEGRMSRRQRSNFRLGLTSSRYLFIRSAPARDTIVAAANFRSLPFFFCRIKRCMFLHGFEKNGGGFSCLHLFANHFELLEPLVKLHANALHQERRGEKEGWQRGGSGVDRKSQRTSDF